MHKVVIPEVLHALKHHCEKPTSLTSVSLKRALDAESMNEVEVDEDRSQVCMAWTIT